MVNLRKEFDLGKIARFYIYRTISSCFTIPQGVASHHTGTIFSCNSLPAKLFLCFYSQKRKMGHIGRNLERMEMPKGLDSIELTLDGQRLSEFESLFHETLSSDFLNFAYARAFMQNNSYYTQSSCPISLDQFGHDYFCVFYNLATETESVKNAP